MTPSRRDVVLAGGVAAALAAGGGWWYHRKKSLTVPRSLLLAGSTSMHPLNRVLVEGFGKLQPKVTPVAQAGGSLAGLLALKRGTIDVAAMSRDLTEEEDTLQTHNFLIAFNEVSVIVHPSLPVTTLNHVQLRAIFTGQITNWKALGGPNAEIHVVSRPDGASSLRFLEEELLDGDEVVLTASTMTDPQQMGNAVAGDPHAIGFLAMSEHVTAAVRRLAVDGVLPDRTTILSGRYPLTQPFYLVLYREPSQAALDFVKFARGPQGQAIVKRLGLTAVG